MKLNLIFLIVASILVVESLILFISPSGVKKMIREILNIPDKTIRMLTAIIIFIGIIIIHFLRNRICI